MESITASQAFVGAFPIFRFLPRPRRKMVGPFIFLDGGGPVDMSESSGVPEHPHAGLSTFTYLLSVKVRHEDSAGNVAVFETGDIALMTAGSGITHEEMPIAQPGEKFQFLQFWLALPDELEETDPSFQHVRRGEIPVVRLPGAIVRVGMGDAFGVRGPARADVETVFAEIELAPGGSVDVPPDWAERAFVVIDGEVSADGDPLHAGRMYLPCEGETVSLGSENGGRVALFGGETFPSPRFIAASFVASDQRKISEWITRVSLGDFPRIQRAGDQHPSDHHGR